MPKKIDASEIKTTKEIATLLRISCNVSSQSGTMVIDDPTTHISPNTIESKPQTRTETAIIFSIRLFICQNSIQ
jgi:hypothetical protein